MPIECFICSETFTQIPYLRCGHFICADCYCSCKNSKNNNCVICNKKLIRGRKKIN